MATKTTTIAVGRKAKPLPPGYLQALRVFRDYCADHRMAPDQPSFALALGKSKSTARQALQYLEAQGMLLHSGVRFRPYLLSDEGAKVLRRAERIAHKQQKTTETEVAA